MGRICRIEGFKSGMKREWVMKKLIQYNKYNTKFVKRHVAVASEALANRTVKKHRRRRTNVL